MKADLAIIVTSDGRYDGDDETWTTVPEFSTFPNSPTSSHVHRARRRMWRAKAKKEKTNG